jgi:hypothetical protein
VLQATKAVAEAWPASKMPDLMASLLAALSKAPAALWIPLIASALSALPSPDALGAFTRVALTAPARPNLLEGSGMSPTTSEHSSKAQGSSGARDGTEQGERKWMLEVLAGVFERERFATIAGVLGRLLLEDCGNAKVTMAAPARRVVSFAAAQLTLRREEGVHRGALEGLQKTLEASIVQLQLLHQV